MSEIQTLDVLDLQGKKAASIELSAEIFDIPTNIPFMHQVVVAQLAATRQGTHAMKTHGMVSGSGKKSPRQKGTGNAHQGSIRALHFIGGGTVHGPQPRDYDQHTPRKTKQDILRSALSDRACNGHIHIVTVLTEGEIPKTKIALTVLCAIVEDRQVLIILERNGEIIALNLCNIPEIHILWVDQPNTYGVLDVDDIVFTQVALESFLGTKEEIKRAPSKRARTPATSS